MTLSESIIATIAPRGSSGRRLLAGAVSFALAWSLLLAFSAPSLAAPGTRVDVEPELTTVVAGTSVTLTASVADSDGDPSIGSDTNTHVRWYFTDDSPNSPGSPGSSPDLECWTGTVGSCTVSYVPAAVGADTVCAVVASSVHSCDEAQPAPEWDNHSDTVLVTVTDGPQPTPTPTPDPTPSPTPDPTPTATPDPTPTPTPDPTPTPTPDPTPSPTPDPTPTPTPDPTPDPTPSPMPDPTPDSIPDPTADPTTSPEPKPLAPSPGGSSEPVPNPIDEPEPAQILPEPEPDAAEPDSTAASEEPRTATVPLGRLDPAPVPPAVPVPSLPTAPAAGPGRGITPTAVIQPSAPTGLVAQVVAAAVDGVTWAVQPEAAITVASEFTFPITLALAVIGYLMVQGHIDRRDPKLRLAPQHVVETIVKFEREAEL